MGQMLLFEDQVRIIGEHNDTPVSSVEDEWGIHPVYQIATVYWENLTSKNQTIAVSDDSGGTFVYTMEPFETGLKNLPTPIRFLSYPLTVQCTLVR